MQYTSYHDLLTEEFERRKDLNTSYSLRAFARDLEIAPPRLSLILKKKQGISIKTAQEIAKKLKLNDKKREWFCHSVGSMHARSFKERNSYKDKANFYKEEAKVFTELHLEYFKVIADWYHFAILEMTYLEDFQNDVTWISRVLGVTTVEVETAIERMKKLELLKEEDGKLKDVFKFLATPSDVPSIALKKFNSQLMKKASEALYVQEVSEREIAANIFALDREKVPLFKEKLRDFRRELEHEASQCKTKDSVYCLSMQFFNLTQETL